MKRICSVFLTLFILVPCCLTAYADADTYIPSRTINLVYDDSGSMIRVGSEYVDTWCQAKYAMEVFAGMLGENETLNIYYMSDYVYSTGAPPKLSLTGSKDAAVTAANVAKIHDLVTDASDTPFNAVKKAYEDLKKSNSDERWLVVLTDGEFNGTSNASVERYYNECVADGQTRVMMLSMGPNAAVITPDPERHIYFEKAESTLDILSKLTRICNRIFQSNALPIDTATNEISFNIPMSQLVVFAQGKNAEIEGITPAGGTMINASSNVRVQYSPTATTDKNYPPDKVIVSDDLNGYVATYNTDFQPGEYTVNVSGADNVQIYYKPNVSIAAYLFNDDNEEVTAKDNLLAGTYRLEFGFTDAATGEKLTDTSLLGNVEYRATMTNTLPDGEVNEYEAKSGDTITLSEGRLDIDVTAQFLEYNTVNAALSYQVFFTSQLLLELESKPTYELDIFGFKNPDDPILLSVMIDNGNGPQSLTPQQWELLDPPAVTTTAELGEFRVEKLEEIGKFRIYPVLKDGTSVDGDIPIRIRAQFKQGLSSADGSLSDSFPVRLCTNELVFSFDQKPSYTVDVGGFTDPNAYMLLSVRLNTDAGLTELTPEQWELLGVPSVTTTEAFGDFRIEKSSQPGQYKVYPTLKDGDPLKTGGGTVPIAVEGGFKQGYVTIEGQLSDSFTVENTISFFDRAVEWLKENWLKLTLWLLLILLILGYIPPFKKYLPRKLKKRPLIECSAERIGVRDTESHGKYKRKLITTLIPYKAETGFVVFSPSPHKKTAQLRAAGGNGIYVTNMKMFAGKEDISFNGMSIEAGRLKPYRISSGSTISLKTAEYTYTCYLNR